MHTNRHILNTVYFFHIRKAPKYVTQILTELKEEINSSTVIVGDVTTPLAVWIGHPDRESIGKQRIWSTWFSK